MGGSREVEKPEKRRGENHRGKQRSRKSREVTRTENMEGGAERSGKFREMTRRTEWGGGGSNKPGT
jgi:hypothetical protein